MGNERIERIEKGGAPSFIQRAGELIWRVARNAAVAVRTGLANNAEKARDAGNRRRGKPTTLLQVCAANSDAGHHFFDTRVAAHSALRFESRLLEGGYFVVSERDGAFRALCNRDTGSFSDRRYYTVKRFNYRTAEVEDASQPGEFFTKEDAIFAAMNYNNNKKSEGI